MPESSHVERGGSLGQKMNFSLSFILFLKKKENLNKKEKDFFRNI